MSKAGREIIDAAKAVLMDVTEGSGDVWLDLDVVPSLDDWRRLNEMNGTSYPYPWRKFAQRKTPRSG